MNLFYLIVSQGVGRGGGGWGVINLFAGFTYSRRL